MGGQSSLPSAPPNAVDHVQRIPALCIVVGSSGFSSQPDLLQLRQYLTICGQGGLPASHVRIFVPPAGPGLSTLSETLDPREAALAIPQPYDNGEAALPIPQPYDNAQCITTDLTDLSTDVLDVCQDFTNDPTVSCIVFIYLDHGSDAALGLPKQPQISTTEFLTVCHHVTKPFLVVLDCCESAAFADKVLQRIRAHQWQCDIAFLTSANHKSFTSAVLISTDDDVVYHCNTGGPMANLPVSYRIRIRHSAILQALAYRMAANDPTLLSEWPGQLNDAVRMKNGFHMAFQSDSAAMANLPVRFFFPWGPFDENETLLWAPVIRFNAAVGGLSDDIGNFWVKPGDQVRLPNGTVETKLKHSDPWEGPIRDHIAAFRSGSAPEKEDPNHIPLEVIADMAYDKILALHEGGFQPGDVRDPEWKATLRKRIAEFNGPIEGYETEAISQLYYVTAALSAVDREKCLGLIEEARGEVVEAVRRRGEPQNHDHEEEEEEEEQEESQA
jgi:hypothetical protein